MNEDPRDIAAVVWRWKESANPVTPPTHTTRAVIQALIMFTVAGTFAFYHRTIPSCIVGSLGLFVLVSGIFFPPAFSAFEKSGRLLGRGIGTVMTWLLLVPFFYICFPAMRLINTLAGKDPLQRKLDKNQKSYWVDRKPVSGPEHYTRQF